MKLDYFRRQSNHSNYSRAFQYLPDKENKYFYPCWFQDIAALPVNQNQYSAETPELKEPNLLLIPLNGSDGHFRIAFKNDWIVELCEKQYVILKNWQFEIMYNTTPTYYHKST